jgi:hypothetical protein
MRFATSTKSTVRSSVISVPHAAVAAWLWFKRRRRSYRDKTRGGIATGLPVAGEYAIPAAGAWKALLVLLINAGRYLKVLVLFVEVALILSLKVGGQQVFTV